MTETEAHPETLPVAGDLFNGLKVRELLPDTSGVRFLVQDEALHLYLVAPDGVTELGEAPDIGLVAAWQSDGPGYAYAMKVPGTENYAVVTVNADGQKRVVEASGYPGAITFWGQGLHWIDADGWKMAAGDEPTTLLAHLNLPNRTANRAWCTWLPGGPLCVGGYATPGGETADSLTLVQAHGEPISLVRTGEKLALRSAIFTPDGRVVVTNLQKPGNPTVYPEPLVAVWLDEQGRPSKRKAYPLMTGQIAFDAWGRLVALERPEQDAEFGRIILLDLESGTPTTLLTPKAPTQFAMSADGRRLYLVSDGAKVEFLPLSGPPAK